MSVYRDVTLTATRKFDRWKLSDDIIFFLLKGWYERTSRIEIEVKEKLEGKKQPVLGLIKEPTNNVVDASYFSFLTTVTLHLLQFCYHTYSKKKN